MIDPHQKTAEAQAEMTGASHQELSFEVVHASHALTGKIV